MVDPAEVGHDDGHRQGDHQHAAERADGAEDLPGDGVRNHVAVPAGREPTHLQSNMLSDASHTPTQHLHHTSKPPGPNLQTGSNPQTFDTSEGENLQLFQIQTSIKELLSEL